MKKFDLSIDIWYLCEKFEGDERMIYSDGNPQRVDIYADKRAYGQTVVDSYR